VSASSPMVSAVSPPAIIPSSVLVRLARIGRRLVRGPHPAAHVGCLEGWLVRGRVATAAVDERLHLAAEGDVHLVAADGRDEAQAEGGVAHHLVHLEGAADAVGDRIRRVTLGEELVEADDLLLGLRRARPGGRARGGARGRAGGGGRRTAGLLHALLAAV